MARKLAPNPVDSLAASVVALKAKAASIPIKYLRFPNYRNLELGCRINFAFPVTVLLGKNGTNKSSILHALYGSVEKKSVAEFWFETKLDAIPEAVDGVKQSVVHAYERNGQVVECVKARAPRGTADPDYWEPIKPTTVYGFPAGVERVSPIQLHAEFLDFRGELPAFDRYFYFPDPKHLETRSKGAKTTATLRRSYRKQDYLRRRSTTLKGELASNGMDIAKDELAILSYILGRDYLGGRMLEHSLFHGHRGWTIVFQSQGVNGYSDAFAGSGESAATLLVHKILATPDKSLILLDEPETSLHPQAQQRLLEFIAHQAVRRNLQVVIATHSIYLAEGLPISAIRVLEVVSSGRVRIDENTSATEALHAIKAAQHGRSILVEDKRAAAIVLAALKKSSEHAADEFQVVVRDGGTSRIFRDIQAHANGGRDDFFVVFDGDHRPAEAVPDVDDLPSSVSKLDKLISKLTKGPNPAGPTLDFVDKDERLKFIRFIRNKVRYLPSQTPEALVWSDAEAAKLVDGDPSELLAIRDLKSRIEGVAKRAAGMDSDSVFRVMLNAFLRGESSQHDQLKATIDEIRSAAK